MLNPQRLTVLRELAQRGSFTAAADALSYTQSAVSQQISALERETGAPLAVMDGRLITEMRTAAVSAAATNLLARKGAKVLAILGSGVQARSHLSALRLVRLRSAPARAR